MMAAQEKRKKKDEVKRRKAEIAVELAKNRARANLSEQDEPVASTSTSSPPSTPCTGRAKLIRSESTQKARALKSEKVARRERAIAMAQTARHRVFRQLRQQITSLSLKLQQRDVWPLHTLQGCVNTILKAMRLTDKLLCRLFTAAQVKPSHQTASLLNGRDCRRLLKFVNSQKVDVRYTHPKLNVNINLRPVFEQLWNVERWAIAYELEYDVNEICIDIHNFSMEWRKALLPAINKLHMIEAHVSEFLQNHRSWGVFGEQGLESLHHVANVAAEKCFGVNADERLPFFMKRQLITDASEFGVRKRNRSGTPATGEPEQILFEDELVVEREEEVEWYDEEEI